MEVHLPDASKNNSCVKQILMFHFLILKRFFYIIIFSLITLSLLKKNNVHRTIFFTLAFKILFFTIWNFLTSIYAILIKLR